ncbi:thiamine pyrophosphate-dependent enzyme [Sporosarcina sp. ACRSM]|uniref:thiamine pyrophosphate-dependent enzyme n=1 Tax=Sporosarcina sp. ACRSM TaxID=2918216 RepID=UPI001EF41C09|nr:thiamine pyrophosphate-dependent enzyme [Sporosarcina sp. ACRSM]MCG7337653.1 thiamine pyrophosphate-dependent enzyme [Sporosarcina sp. ACRSM]
MFKDYNMNQLTLPLDLDDDSRVITINGDGGICFGISELATLSHFNLKATHIILNNGSLEWVKYIQKMHYGSRFMPSNVPNIDFATVTTRCIKI